MAISRASSIDNVLKKRKERKRSTLISNTFNKLQQIRGAPGNWFCVEECISIVLVSSSPTAIDIWFFIRDRERHLISADVLGLIQHVHYGSIHLPDTSQRGILFLQHLPATCRVE
jgi:hypothetical protein